MLGLSIRIDDSSDHVWTVRIDTDQFIGGSGMFLLSSA